MQAQAVPAADPQGSAGSTPVIEVEIVDTARLAALGPEVSDLTARTAEPNAFMEPAWLAAAAAREPVHVVLAWDRHPVPARLLGLWALTPGRPAKLPLPIRVLQPPAEDYTYLSTPLIDAAHGEDVLARMLDAIAASPLPKIVALPRVQADGPVMAALTRVLERRAASLSVLARGRRPLLVAGLDGKTYLERALSSSTRKKLRQHRRRLGEHGALTRSIHREPAAVAAALEQFLTLEASGWKGARGTAMLSDPATAAFARTAINGLAAHGRAMIDALLLDGQPVSMQVILCSGRAAFTWKTAFDEHFHDYSPGMLLFEDYTQSLLAEPGILCVDSCALDELSFMAAWTERREIAHVWFDARPGGSMMFRLAAGAARIYGEQRAAAKRLYARSKGRTHRVRAETVATLLALRETARPEPADHA